MTVSFVLNNKPGQVSEQTRARVLQTIREMGYRPTALERNLETQRIRTIGVVTGAAGSSLVSNGYHGEIFKGLLSATEESVNDVLVFPHKVLHDDVSRAIRTYCDGRCDGLVIISPHYMSDLLDSLKERGFPFVTISHLGDDPTVSCVDVDNWRESARAINYLYSKGHRRIGMVDSFHKIQSAKQRREGFLQAMCELSLPVLPEFLWSETMKPGEIETFVNELIQRPSSELPTAIYCWNDGTAFRWMEALQKVGLQVPEAISLIGFDNEREGSISHPPLTTFQQPYEQISRKAIEILLAHINDLTFPPQTVLFPAELIIRDSVRTIEPSSLP